jgi:ADP-ribose pyrophosphatase
VHAGGGEESEDIEVHEVALVDVNRWLKRRARAGCLIDPKVYAGLYLIQERSRTARPAGTA